MVNKVILIGNLGKDAEIRSLPSGQKMARFTLATNENYRDKNGNWQTVTDWHDIVAWRGLADRAERDCKKGKMVYIEGRLRRRKYTDQNGVEKIAVEVEADMIRLLDRREGTSNEEGIQPSYQKDNNPPGDLHDQINDINEEDDDLPF